MNRPTGFRSTCTLIGLLACLPCGAPAAAETDTSNWTEKVTVSADLRLRYEMIQEDGQDDRNRARFRGRVAIEADVAPDIRAVLGLATGGDDPVSTNQTFGDGFSTKDIGVDFAYVEWDFVEGWALIAGKMPKPWFRAGGSTIIWDNDLNPEGLAVEFQHRMLFGSMGSYIINERADGPESRLNTIQAGVDIPFSNRSGLIVALSYFDYTNTIGQAPFYDDDPQGNTVDANGNYVFDYNEVEFAAEYRTRAGNWPLTFFGDYVVNTEAATEDTAYSVGVIAGKAREPGSMQFGYSWHDTDADGVNATYNDSDLADGQTDSSGHYFRARYQLRENIYFNGSFIFSEFGAGAGNAIGFDRVMLDVQFEF
ncbi:MAG: putative porin [Woeseiaceae bacterium]